MVDFTSSYNLERGIRERAAQDGALALMFGNFTGNVYENTYVEVYIPVKNATFRCLPILPFGFSAVPTKQWADSMKEGFVFAISFAYAQFNAPLIVGVVPRPKQSIDETTASGNQTSQHAENSSITQEHATGNVTISNKKEDPKNPVSVVAEKDKVAIGKLNTTKQPVALGDKTAELIGEFVDTMKNGFYFSPAVGQVAADPTLIASLEAFKAKIDSLKSKELVTA